ncbi:MAG: DUF354 domain-containing protein [Candidatus Kapaibacterium sp.]
MPARSFPDIPFSILYPRLWIDLDNSPHVPLFAPLIRQLRREGWDIRITARDFAQTLDLVDQLKIDAVAVGAHAGRSKLKKLANLPVRAFQLMRAVRDFRPQIALSHGSRTQALASRLLGIPQIVMFDYEWTEMSILKRFATHLVCPAALTPERLTASGIGVEKVSWYHGFKEEMYLPEFVPDPGFRASIGVGEERRLITIRPPGLIGNYHDPRSEEICRTILARAATDPANYLVILPKTRLERQLVDSALPANPAAGVLIPERALPGLQLLHYSNLAISGGGTMNRESALLGVPTYSIFTGHRAAIDEELARRGLLRFIGAPEEIDQIDWVGESPELHASSSLQRNTTLVVEIRDMIAKFAALHT